MGKVIVITSGKGGAGKTTVTANLGTALSLTGKRVLLIDTDTGLRNLDMLLGFEDKALYEAEKEKDRAQNQARRMIQSARESSEFVLKEISELKKKKAEEVKKEELDKEKFKAFCDEEKKRFDYILIDCPAGIEYGFECALYPADEAIIVAVPDRAAMRDADKVAGIIETEYPNIGETRLIVNRLIPELAKPGKIRMC